MSERLDAWNAWMQDGLTRELVDYLRREKVERLYNLRHSSNWESYCNKDGFLDAITSILEFIEEMQKE